MKPNFTLSLSFEGIRLLHRAAGGWRDVGEVALDTEDMGAELAVLRRTATALDSGGLRTKLLLPNEQIKYMTIDTAGMDENARREAAHAALDGASPYPVEDLAFDLNFDGDKTHIAAVAKETLAEAESFANEHRFYPVYFAAVPDEHSFLGEPFFGNTQAAASILEPGEKVEPDGVAVVVIGGIEAPKAPVEKTSEPVEDVVAPVEKAPEPVETASEPVVETPEPAEAMKEPVVATPEPVEAAPEPVIETPEPVEATPTPLEVPAEPEEEASEPVESKPEPVKPTQEPVEIETKPSDIARDLPAEVVKKPAPAESVAFEVETAPEDPVEEPRAAVDDASSLSKPPTPPPSVDAMDEPPVDAAEAKLALRLADKSLPSAPPAVKIPRFTPPEETTPSSIAENPAAEAQTVETAPKELAAKPQEAPTAATKDATPVPPVPVVPRLGAALREAEPPKTPTVQTPVERPKVQIPSTGFSSRRSPDIDKTTERREPVVAAPVLPNAGSPTAPAVKSPLNGTVAAKPAAEPIKPDSASLKPEPKQEAAPAGGFLSRRKAKVTTGKTKNAKPAKAPGAAHEARSEAERMTVFGARRHEVGGKPRFLGLILTAALLVFLAGVAAWASVFMDDGMNLSRLFGDRAPKETAVASFPIDGTDGTEEEGAEAEEPVGVQTASLDPRLTEEDTAVLDALQEPVPAIVDSVSTDEMEENYATTGIWPLAPISPPEPASLVNLDDLYLTSIDPISSSNDAVALPAVASFGSDRPLGGILSPVAAGTVFALDGNGLVIPTSQGALNPQGVLVYLGSPPITPPEGANRIVVQPQGEEARAILAAFRPNNRPADLAENNERAQLDGLTRNELAGLRPELRPRSLQQQAEAARAAEAAAEEAAAAQQAALQQPETIQTDAAVAAALAPPKPDNAFENVTRLAAAASARPDTRPRNFARIVRRAQRTPEPQAAETRVASAASVAPRSVTPSAPSKTSVARQATVKNAINLRKVNLIGVYGKPNSRRALVRLGNGRYQKVVVGDRIDGGRVSAIGESELRYSKGGRNVVLQMPRG